MTDNKRLGLAFIVAIGLSVALMAITGMGLAK